MKIGKKLLSTLLAAAMLLQFCLPVTAAGASSAVNLPNDTSEMFAWFKLDDQSGGITTDAVSSRKTIQNKDITLTQGQDGKAFDFNGTTSFVKVNNKFDNQSQITDTTFLHPAIPVITAAMWVRIADKNTRQIIYDQGGSDAGLAVGVDGGALKAAVSAGTPVEVLSKPLADADLNRWIHIAVVFNKGKVNAYVDGELVKETAGFANAIPKTINATELGASSIDTNAFGWNGACWFKGAIDDLRLYKVAVAPNGGSLSEAGTFLQCADKKNFYICANGSAASVQSRTEPSVRSWVKEPGLADENGVSLRLADSDRYITAAGGTVSVKQAVSGADKQAATFFPQAGGYVPGWGEKDRAAFYTYQTYDKSGYLAHTDSGLTVAANADAQTASFKDTGDQTDIFKDLRGIVYYPTYALNAPQFWQFYDSAIIERDMKYAKQLGINAYRIWVSFEYWQENPEHFKAAYDDFLDLAEKYEIKILVSLFEGCGGNYDYDSASRTSRSYKDGWSVTSPSAKIYNNKNRWGEPKEFVKWFFDQYKNDDRHLAIELYNEPWDTRDNLAKELLAYAVTLQGDTPISLGSPETNYINWVTDLGADMIQYHDNFPGTAEGFKNNAYNKIALGKDANLPVYCTEVQRVTVTTLPNYANLAPTCNEIMKTGKWAPFYWTLMVHPCYLDGNRKQYNMINGIFWEDGSVWSENDARAIADNPALKYEQDQTSPYTQYYYKNLFTDNFIDSKLSKWDVNGKAAVKDGAVTFGGDTAMTAKLTMFENFVYTAKLTLNSADHAGLTMRGYSAVNGDFGLTAELDKTGKLTLSETQYSVEKELKSVQTDASANGTHVLKAVLNGDDIELFIDGKSVLNAKTSLCAAGAIGVAGGNTACISDACATVEGLEKPRPSTPTGVKATYSKGVGCTLFWNGSKDAESYVVARAGASGEVIVAENVTECTYVDKDGAQGMSYTVTAKNKNGLSGRSVTAEARVTADKGDNVALPAINDNNGYLWYKMDEPEDAVSMNTALTGERRAINLLGQFLPGEGKYGGALELDSTGGGFQCNNDDVDANGFLHGSFNTESVSLWIAPYKLDCMQMIYCQGGSDAGAAIRLNCNKLEAAVACGDEVYHTKPVVLDNSYINRWTNIVLSFNKGEVALYLDGVKKDEAQMKATAIPASRRATTVGNVMFGETAFGDFSGLPFCGMVDDLRIYKSVIVPKNETVKPDPKPDPKPQPEPIAVEKVRINSRNFSITVGGKKAITAEYLPNNASGAKIVWSTGSKKIAEVQDGKLIARGVGKTVITAKAGGKSASITVTVTPKKVKKLKVTKKGKKVTVKIKKAAKAYKTYIAYRKNGRGKYKKLALTAKAAFNKKLKKGRYQIKACSYYKGIKSGYGKVFNIKIK